MSVDGFSQKKAISITFLPNIILVTQKYFFDSMGSWFVSFWNAVGSASKVLWMWNISECQSQGLWSAASTVSPRVKALLLLITKIKDETCTTSFKVSEAVYITQREQRDAQKERYRLKRTGEAGQEKNILSLQVCTPPRAFHWSHVVLKPSSNTYKRIYLFFREEEKIFYHVHVGADNPLSSDSTFRVCGAASN